MELNSIDIQAFCELQGGINKESQYFLERLYKGQKKSFWEWHEFVSLDVELVEPKFPNPAKSNNKNK